MVDGEQNREDYDQHWREDLEEHPEVANEEVGVQAAFPNELHTGRIENRLDPAYKTVWRYGNTLSLWHQVCSRAIDASEAPSQNEEDGELDESSEQSDRNGGPEALPALVCIGRGTCIASEKAENTVGVDVLCVG